MTRSRDSDALVQPAAWQKVRQPDDVCCMVAALHFLAALWLDPRHHLCYAYITIMNPKTKTTNMKQKGVAPLSKRAPRKSARKPTMSVVTQPDLDDSEQILDRERGGGG